MAAASHKTRALRPKEHGAYGQLGLPLAAALAMGHPGIASVLLTVAAIAVFIAHEPLLVVVGARGDWAQREHGPRARRHAMAWTAVAMASGGLGLWLAGAPAIRAAWLPVGLVLVLIPFVLRGAEKTLPGELIAALALAGAALPVAAAGNVPSGAAWGAWGAWALAFSASTAAVRWVIASHKGRNHPLTWVWVGASTLGALLLAVRTPIVVAALPMLLASWALIVRPPHARHLNRIGWSLVASGTLTATALGVLGRWGA